MSTPPAVDLSSEWLKAIASQQGVDVKEADLEAVLGFLRVLLPQLRELEDIVAPDTVPAGLFLPAEES